MAGYWDVRLTATADLLLVPLIVCSYSITDLGVIIELIMAPLLFSVAVSVAKIEQFRADYTDLRAVSGVAGFVVFRLEKRGMVANGADEIF